MVYGYCLCSSISVCLRLLVSFDLDTLVPNYCNGSPFGVMDMMRNLIVSVPYH